MLFAINLINQIIHFRCLFGVGQTSMEGWIKMKQSTMNYSVSIQRTIFGQNPLWLERYRLLVLDIPPASSTILCISLVALTSTRFGFFKTSISSIWSLWIGAALIPASVSNLFMFSNVKFKICFFREYHRSIVMDILPLPFTIACIFLVDRDMMEMTMTPTMYYI